MAVIVGITAFPYREQHEAYKLLTSYTNAITQAGGTPLLIPVLHDTAACADIISRLDALLIPGGDDVAPVMYGETQGEKVTFARRDFDRFECGLVHAARAAGMNILGICRGMQLINVAHGGTLYQDIPTDYKGAISHFETIDLYDEPLHTVTLDADSELAKIFGTTELDVNSFHHQGLKGIAEGFKVVGRSPDGLPEAMESADGRVLCTQFHPEWMAPRYPVFAKLFGEFIRRATK